MQVAWDVFLDGCWIDTVWFCDDMDQRCIKLSLVRHDGYSPRIVVVRCSRKL